jgi:predicted phosphoadenosine phosphosulfate sulfurtransferase
MSLKFYREENVFDAAMTRFRWLFDEFENIVVNFSGGKDSTVCLNLALAVAEEKGRLPLPVLFLDQEAEWQNVIDYIRVVMTDPRIKPMWLQVPFKIFNATSTREPWLYCWEPGREWVRDKEPISIRENPFGTDRFHEMFGAVFRYYFPDSPAIHIAGVRAEESPARMKGLTSYETYKGETWGKVEDKRRQHFTMYPIYDWSYTDVWKAIHDNRWPYCKLYDYMYQYGVPVPNMRVSNVHHETAVRQLFFLQEIEGDTWNRITSRISGINTAGQLQDKFFKPKDLPPMFADWYEYRDHLLENLVPDEHREQMRRSFAAWDARYVEEIQPQLVRTQIGAILANDYEGTKLTVFAASHGRFSKNAGTKGGRFVDGLRN